MVEITNVGLCLHSDAYDIQLVSKFSELKHKYAPKSMLYVNLKFDNQLEELFIYNLDYSYVCYWIKT